jgi:hypothetical protein
MFVPKGVLRTDCDILVNLPLGLIDRFTISIDRFTISIID